MSDNGLGDVELEIILRGLEKIEEIARTAYYSTPPHIQSKALIERIMVLSRNLYTYIQKRYALHRD